MSVNLTTNPIWIQRIGSFFDSLDLNHDKHLTIAEILKWAANIEKACKASPEKIKALQNGLQDFWGVVGLIPGVYLTKEQFLHGFNRLAQNELKRKAENKPTLHETLNNAFFDVADMNDDGYVTLQELTTVVKACNMDAKDAEAWFNAADVNKDAKVERKEMNKVEFDFWFRPEEPTSEGMFAALVH